MEDSPHLGAGSFKNVQFCPRSRKTKILTTGIYIVFRGLKFESDERDWAKGGVFQRSPYNCKKRTSALPELRSRMATVPNPRL